MPEPPRRSKSLKCLTLTAVILLAIVLVPYVVVEKARRDAARVFIGARFDISRFRFDPDSWLILEMRATPKSPHTIEMVDWGLRQWDVTLIISFPDAFGGLSALDKPIDLGDIIEDAEDSGPQDLPRFILSGPEVEPERVQDVP